MAIERISIKTGAGFDPLNPVQTATLLRKIEETEHGVGWAIQSFNPEDGTVTLTRHSAVTQVSKSVINHDSYDVNLAAGTKPSDGEQVAAQLESDPRHLGYVMTSFEPFLGQATLSKLSDNERRCRGAVATALTVKPWQIQVSQTRAGGFTLQLPPSYVPSKHDAKLDEVATTVVGRPGWFVKTNPAALTAEIIPSDPPTFPDVVPYPLDRLRAPSRDRSAFGLKLPATGKDDYIEADVNWASQAFLMIAGMPGAGKLNALSTPVPVPVSDRFPAGWATIGTLEVGDQVYARDGSIVPVTGISPIQERELVKITFSDGQTTVCDVEHLWAVSTRSSRRENASSELFPPDAELVQDARRASRGEVAPANWFAEKLGCTPEAVARFAETTGLPTDKRIIDDADVSVYPVDELLYAWAQWPVIDNPVLRLRTAGQLRTEAANDLFAVPVTAAIDTSYAPLEFPSYLRGYKAGAAAIEPAYLRASLPQRWELLRGIMDASGDITETGICQLPFSNEAFRDSALELIRSLGIRATAGTDGIIEFTTTGRVFSDDRADLIPTETSDEHNWLYILDVEPVGLGQGVCIRVDHPEHLFLIEQFVPTHNTVTLNAIIAGQLAAGVELVVCDVPDKKVDFMWMKKWCRDGGWGADSDLETLTALSLVYEEGKRRSKIIEKHGVTNWTELPESVKFNPILVVVDEVSGLLVTEKLPAGVPKDNPVVKAKLDRNLVRVSIEDVITRILAEQRAFGIRMVLATQVTNASTGIGPSQKAKIGHKILQGSNPSKTARTQAFNDEAGVPFIPDNIRQDAKIARGVGAAELEGVEPFIYKSYYASTDQYADALTALRLPTTSRPAPTATEIARFSPLEDDWETGGFGRNETYVPREDGLKGAAAAAHDLKVAEARAARATPDYGRA